MTIEEQDTLKEVIEFYVDNCKNAMQKTQIDYEQKVIQNKLDKAQRLKYKYCNDVIER